MKRAIVVVAMLALACGGSDPSTHTMPAESTRSLSATSREWITVARGDNYGTDPSLLGETFSALEPDDSYEVTAEVIGSDGTAPGVASVYKTPSGFLIRLLAPVDATGWAAYRIVASGLRNGG